MVKGKELIVPAAVLRRFLAQVAAFGALFTRHHGQKKRMAFVVTNALLHFALRKMKRSTAGAGLLFNVNPCLQESRGNFSSERRSAQRCHGAHKSCPVIAQELIVKMLSAARTKWTPCRCHQRKAFTKQVDETDRRVATEGKPSSGYERH